MYDTYMLCSTSVLKIMSYPCLPHFKHNFSNSSGHLSHMPHGISSTFLTQKPPIFLIQLEGKPENSEQMLNIVEVYLSHFLLFTSLVRNVVEKISAFILFSFTQAFVCLILYCFSNIISHKFLF